MLCLVKIVYKNATALVMPTYFGPTNIPPLDAWDNELPVIYSYHLSEQTDDAAIYVDPNSSEDLADQIEKMLNKEFRQELIKKGSIKLSDIKKKREDAINTLLNKFNEYEKIQKNWKI